MFTNFNTKLNIERQYFGHTHIYIVQVAKSVGVSLSSEGRQRVIAQQQIGENIDSETAPFSFSLPGGGNELRAAAHVFIPRLREKVFQLLEENEK